MARVGRLWQWLDERHAARHAPTPGEPAGERPDPQRPAGTDLLPKIRHIVVLMMENHSYDNYFATLGRGEGLPLGPDGEPVAVNSGVRAHHLTATTQLPDVPTQTWYASHLQYHDGACDGFVRSIEVTQPWSAHPEQAMGYWNADDLPFYHGLARTFALADHWFSSCLGPTLPNRRFLVSGTAHGLMDNLPVNLFDQAPAGTIFDALTRHGISWANYHAVSRTATIAPRLLGEFGLRAGRRACAEAVRWVPSLIDLFRGNVGFTANVYPLGLGAAITHLRGLDDFFADAAAGTLPAVSIVDPAFGRFDEHNPQDVRLGESFAADVVAAVMHGPAWPGTLLLWLYDEHGGYYDHVAPPAAVRPDDVDGRNRLQPPRWAVPLLRPVFGRAIDQLDLLDRGDPRYDRLGFRVPAVVVSPYARAGTVVSTTFDHTSVLRLIEQKWNLPPLTRRDAAASAPLDALDLTGEPTFAVPPPLPEPALGHGAWRGP